MPIVLTWNLHHGTINNQTPLDRSLQVLNNRLGPAGEVNDTTVITGDFNVRGNFSNGKAGSQLLNSL